MSARSSTICLPTPVIEMAPRQARAQCANFHRFHPPMRRPWRRGNTSETACMHSSFKSRHAPEDGESAWGGAGDGHNALPERQVSPGYTCWSRIDSKSSPHSSNLSFSVLFFFCVAGLRPCEDGPKDLPLCPQLPAAAARATSAASRAPTAYGGKIGFRRIAVPRNMPLCDAWTCI